MIYFLKHNEVLSIAVLYFESLLPVDNIELRGPRLGQSPPKHF